MGEPESRGVGEWAKGRNVHEHRSDWVYPRRSGYYGIAG